MSDKISIFCHDCKKKTHHKHLHNTVYGMPETHMANSERYECGECGRSISKSEGVKKGLTFVLD